MIFKFLCALLLGCLSLCAEEASLPKYKIGVCIVATGKYEALAQEAIASARLYFLKGHEVKFFVFTDRDLPPVPDVVKVHQDQLKWPYATLKRFHAYDENRELFKEMDYLFALDADMRFVAPVGEEILSDLVGTIHPGYFDKQKKAPYEKHKKSTAYVSSKEATTYFAGGFYGGKKEPFLKLVATLKKNINTDLANGVMAVWHDESHLNCYFAHHPPTKALSPAYCYPESWDIPFPKKLLALDKNHTEMRK